MQKWEYLSVSADASAVAGRPVLKAHLVNGRELSDWRQGADIYAYVNHLGEQGWELVTREVNNFAFKRPLP
jgi:hypothetical protein